MLICISVLSVWGVRNKLTYLEYYDAYDDAAARSAITVNKSQDVLVQDFLMPYDIMHGLSLQIATFGRHNNSEWDISLINPETKEAFYSKHFNASLLQDSWFYNIEFGRNLRLTKNARYQVRISASRVSNDSALAFYVAKKNKDSLALTSSGKDYDGTLCLKIYGGDSDSWWAGFVSFVFIIVYLLFFRIYYVSEIRKINWLNDAVIQSCIVGIISFLLLSPFCNSFQFGDETDNILGGLAIAKGGVLYRDYVTQHTPLTYYLCSIFALFGARSVEQFRLVYYLFEAVAWGLLYKRHKVQFGKKMFFLPLFECVVVNSMQLMFGHPAGCMILYDGVQAFCLVVLILELFKFCKDKTWDWSTAAIVSASAWGSLGAAFLSAYVLLWIAFAFFIVEIKIWKNENLTLIEFCKRYLKLSIALCVPLLFVTGYFILNDSLGRAFDLFYSFNREVYSRYTGGFGNSVFALFVYSFQSFFDTVVNDINLLMNAKATTTIVLQLIILITVSSIIVCMLRRRLYLKSVILFLILCSAGFRGYDNYHGLAVWYIAIMVIVLFYDELFDSLPKARVPLLSVVAIYSLSVFIHNLGDNLLYEQKSVSDLDCFIVSSTDENEKILVDHWEINVPYLLYKNREIINRVPYIMPWYVDWYEKDLIEDLKKNKTRYVVFNEDANWWGHTHFANNFVTVLKQNYTRLSNSPADGWKYHIWKINE